MYTRKELRAKARQQLGGNIFAKTWLMVLLAIFIVSAIEGGLGATFVGTFVVMGPLMYGLYRLLTKQVREGGEVKLEDLFTGFTENFVQALLLQLVETIFIALWSLLFVIPGIVKTYSYAMSSYIQQQSTNKDWNYCHQKSIELMSGYKFKLFLLDLSFIGWYILGALCFGIGTLFVMPYHYMARVNFFEMVLEEKNPQL